MTTPSSIRTGNRHALLLATGQLARVSIGQVGKLKPSKQSSSFGSCYWTTQPTHPEGKFDVLGRRYVLEQNNYLCG